jgi:hypothetical protein
MPDWLVQLLKNVQCVYGVVVLAVSEHAKLLAHATRAAVYRQRLTVLADRLDALERSYANATVLIDMRTEQRDAARRELAVYQAQLGQDMLELCGERDDWKEAAEGRAAALKVLLAAVRQRGLCAACGEPLDRCPELCAARRAYEALAPVAGENFVGEA